MTGCKFKASLRTSVIRWKTLTCLPTTWRKRRIIITTNKNTTNMREIRRKNKNTMVGWNIWNHKTYYCISLQEFVAYEIPTFEVLWQGIQISEKKMKFMKTKYNASRSSLYHQQWCQLNKYFSKNTFGKYDASSIKRWASSTDEDNARSFDECNSINDASFILKMIINTKEDPFKKKE